jgi:Flp pilus assembly pilin Flp
MSLKHKAQRFLRDEQGAELAEYAVGVALLVAIGLVVYKVLGNAINDKNSGTAAKVDSAVSGGF